MWRISMYARGWGPHQMRRQLVDARGELIGMVLSTMLLVLFSAMQKDTKRAMMECMETGESFQQ